MPTRTSQRKTATKQVEAPPPPGPASSTAVPSGMTRRSKRVVESVSPEPEPERETVEPSDEEDAEGEDEEVLREDDEDEGEDMEIDDEFLLDGTTAPTPDETPTPTTSVAPAASGIKLKLTLNGKNKNMSGSSSSTPTTTNDNNAEAGSSSGRATTAREKRPTGAKADGAAFEDDASQASVGTNKGKSTRASKRVKLDVSSEKEDASDQDESMGGGDTSRLTARQRARQGDGGFGEHLMMLPEDTGKKVILSDLEKQARKEENARRRKLQMDQKMENDRNDVINRLLKAQTGKTRRNVAQTEGTPMSGNDGDDGNASADAKNAAIVPGMLRFVSSIKSGNFVMSVSAPRGKEQAIALEDALNGRTGRGNANARCGVDGCGETRKYRSVLDFDRGGCSMPHLKLIEQSMRAK